jgi:hypothetical protein
VTWVELRVHGVSGAPPESLLGVPHVEQVAGDDHSRFFRPSGGDGSGHVLEGYHWGRFTSGTWRQSLALLLVPFGLVNAAQFMLVRPSGRFEKLMHLLAGIGLRLLALVLTALIAFTLGLILIDIVAWRWAPDSDLLDAVPRPWLVVGAAGVAALGVVLLALLGLTTGTRRPPDTPTRVTPESTALDPGFFAADPNALTMRGLHVAAGFGMIALLLALAREGDQWELPVGLLALVALVVIVAGDPERSVTVGFAGTARGTAALRAVTVVLLATAVIVLVVEAVLTHRELRGGAPEDALGDFDHVANGLMVAAVLVLGILHAANLYLVWWGPGPRGWTRRDAAIRLALCLPGLLVAVLVLVVDPKLWVALIAWGVLAITAAMIVIAAFRLVRAGSGPRADETYFAPYAGGMTPFLVSTLSTFVAVGLSAAAANAVAAALPGPDTSTPMLDRVGYAWGLTVVELVLLALIGAGLGALARRRLLKSVEEDYSRPDGEPTVLPPDWNGRVATAMTLAQAKRLLPAAVIVFVAVGLLITGVQMFETFPKALGGDVEDGPLDWLSQPRDARGAAPFVAVGTWLLIAVAGYVVAVSRDAIRNQALRRGINVIWDVFSFWPHAVHPFVPRPYSRWTVIELRNRVRHHLAGTQDGGRAVVVAAHSQGSLIAYAALLTLTGEEQKRVAFLSCGSQLRVIFPRAFPAYVNLATHRALFASLGGAWINLYRRTDVLAGPVLSWAHTGDASRHFPPAAGASGADEFRPGDDRCRRCGNDWRLIDPVPYDADVQTGAVAEIRGHSGFWLDPGWARALDALRSTASP